MRIGRLLLGLLLVGAFIGALAGADEPAMKSDPSRGYFDPDELRQIVLDDFRGETLWALSSRKRPEKDDIRLVDGNIPIFDLDGNVAGYYFIATVVPGEVPTIDDIYAQSILAYPKLKDALNEDEYINNPPKAYDRFFPYYLGCWSAAVWVGDYGPVLFYGSHPHLPNAVYDFGRAAKKAVDYFGRDDITFVRFLIVRIDNAAFAYEFTNRTENILIPFDEDGRMYDIITRAEAEKAPRRAVLPPADADHKARWVEYWRDKLDKLKGETSSD